MINVSSCVCHEVFSCDHVSSFIVWLVCWFFTLRLRSLFSFRTRCRLNCASPIPIPLTLGVQCCHNKHESHAWCCTSGICPFADNITERWHNIPQQYVNSTLMTDWNSMPLKFYEFTMDTTYQIHKHQHKVFMCVIVCYQCVIMCYTHVMPHCNMTWWVLCWCCFLFLLIERDVMCGVSWPSIGICFDSHKQFVFE